jgi:hypothetical protein
MAFTRAAGPRPPGAAATAGPQGPTERLLTMPPLPPQPRAEHGPMLTTRDLLESLALALALAAVVLGAVTFVMASPVLA